MLITLSVAGVLVLMALAAQTWVLRHVFAQQARIQLRLDALALRIATGSTAGPDTTHLEPAPPFDLPSLDHGRATLDRMLAAGNPVVLTFTDPRCAPCYEVLPDIGGWQRIYGDRLTIALVSGGTPDANRAMTAEYGIAPSSVLLQTEREVADAYGARMAPAAVLVGTDGRLDGEVVYGVQAVRQLVADTLDLRMPEPPARHKEQVLAVGDAVPAIRRPDLDGNVVDFAAEVRGEQTLLLFWSPGCTHCQELLPTMRAWEADPAGPHLLIVSRGPVALIQETGLRSTVVLDDDQTVARRFGVMSSPVAFMIDSMGRVASPMARGSVAVRTLGSQRRVPPSPVDR